MTSERHLSRTVLITDASGITRRFTLSVVELSIDDSGEIVRCKVTPFAGETEAVIYHDTPFTCRCFCPVET